MVEGARLESEACQEHRSTLRNLDAHDLNELAASKYRSVSPGKPPYFWGFQAHVSQSYHNRIFI